MQQILFFMKIPYCVSLYRCVDETHDGEDDKKEMDTPVCAKILTYHILIDANLHFVGTLHLDFRVGYWML